MAVLILILISRVVLKHQPCKTYVLAFAEIKGVPILILWILYFSISAIQPWNDLTMM